MAPRDFIRVVMADDHSMIRKSLARELNKNSRIKIVAEENNGSLLIDKIKEMEVLPDVCVLDIRMPVMDGRETLKYMNAHWPTIKCIVLTSYDQEYFKNMMAREGARGFLLKTGDIPELKRAIFQVMETGHYYTEMFNQQTVADALQQAEATLDDMEISFLKLYSQAYSYDEIADKMNVTKAHIESIRKRTSKKLGVNTRQELIQRAYLLELF